MARLAEHSRQPSTGRTLVFIMWGPVAWAVQLTVVYAGHTWFCALGWSPGAAGLLIVAMTIAALAFIAPILCWPQRAARPARLNPTDTDARHLIRMARYLALLSGVAIVWTGTTFALVDACVLTR
jgi:hypothetical protein